MKPTPLILLGMMLSIQSCIPEEYSSNTSTDKLLQLDRDGYVDPPSIRSYPSTMDEINMWISDMDNQKIRAHGWDIWESITQPTVLDIPVWETWYSGYEIFQLDTADDRMLVRNFSFPTQFFHASALTDIPTNPNERPTSFNRFSKSVANVIWDKQYNRKATLDSINQTFDQRNTPIVQRQIQTSVDTTDSKSFVLKPVFQFISKDSIVAIPYWAGVSPQTTTSMTNPEPHTWRQFVVVDPKNQLKPGSTHSIKGGNWPVVPLSDFYAIQLTAEDSINFSQFAAESGDNVGEGDQSGKEDILEMVRPGNYALLVAMHVTGKEIPNWTWQTFWWSPNTENPVYGADRPSSIPAPWSNYNMNTAYYMVSPPYTKKGGEPLITFNPYLETNLTDSVSILGEKVRWYGVFSNCMSCHRMAAYPNNQYISNGFIDPSDTSLFSGITKTDFLWSIPTRAN